MYLLILDQMHNSAVTLKKLLWLNKDAFNKGESYLVSVERYEKKKWIWSSWKVDVNH